MSDTIRSFIAFTLPKDMGATLKDLQTSLMAHGFKVRWVPPESIHLTLKFLGDIQKQDVDAIAEALRDTAAGRNPITFNAKGLALFPGLQRPRILGVGIAGEIAQILDCHQVLDARLAAIGFPREKRPFKGHLTLGRIKGRIPPEKLAKALGMLSGFESKPVRVDRMDLFQSALKPTGAVYKTLLTIPFAKN